MREQFLRMAVVLSLIAVVTGCGYNDFQRLDETTNAAWSEVLNQYQRRADLIPNIVESVKGEANFEQETLTKVIEARAKATSMQVTPETLNDPAAFSKFQQVQGELSSALSRLMVVASNIRICRLIKHFMGHLGRHRKSDWSRPWPLHRSSPGLQCACPAVSDQFDRHAIRL